MASSVVFIGKISANHLGPGKKQPGITIELVVPNDEVWHLSRIDLEIATSSKLLEVFFRDQGGKEKAKVCVCVCFPGHCFFF